MASAGSSGRGASAAAAAGGLGFRGGRGGREGSSSTASGLHQKQHHLQTGSSASSSSSGSCSYNLGSGGPRQGHHQEGPSAPTALGATGHYQQQQNSNSYNNHNNHNNNKNNSNNPQDHHHNQPQHHHHHHHHHQQHHNPRTQTQSHQSQAKPRKENILNLEQYMGREIKVKFAGGREVVGVLSGFDQLMNLVLDRVIETLRDEHGNTTTRPLGLIIARGTVLTAISALEGIAEIPNPFLSAAAQ